MYARKYQLILGEENHQQVIISPKKTIVHTCLDVVTVKDVHGITKCICNIKNKKLALWKHHICLTGSDHYYIIEEIEHRDKIDLERNLRDDGDEEYFYLF